MKQQQQQKQQHQDIQKIASEHNMTGAGFVEVEIDWDKHIIRIFKNDICILEMFGPCFLVRTDVENEQEKKKASRLNGNRPWLWFSRPVQYRK